MVLFCSIILDNTICFLFHLTRICGGVEFLAGSEFAASIEYTSIGWRRHWLQNHWTFCVHYSFVPLLDYFEYCTLTFISGAIAVVAAAVSDHWLYQLDLAAAVVYSDAICNCPQKMITFGI